MLAEQVPLTTVARKGVARCVRWSTVAVVGAGVAAIGALNPARSSVYPSCIFRRLTGLECPGCGCARALHALLHLHLGNAVGYNVLVVLTLPWLGYRYARWLAGRAPVVPRLSGRAILTMAFGVTLFGVLRNVPVPFLAPLSAGG